MAVWAVDPTITRCIEQLCFLLTAVINSNSCCDFPCRYTLIETPNDKMIVTNVRACSIRQARRSLSGILKGFSITSRHSWLSARELQ